MEYLGSLAQAHPIAAIIIGTLGIVSIAAVLFYMAKKEE